ncbi:MAG TPA: response regulator transcription factor [Actinomycetota bacterium]|nr:response regulator transcription factor [Actinomycetota bacterium]
MARTERPTKRIIYVPDSPSIAATIGVVIFEPLRVVGSGMALLVGSQADMAVMGQAATPEETLGALHAASHRRGVVVLVALGPFGEAEALSLIRDIRDRYPAVHIVACGASSRWASVSQALFAGADGYVDKATPPDAFLAGLRRAAEGQVVLEGVSQDWLPGDSRAANGMPTGNHKLTPREAEILGLAAEALTSRQIASRLGLAERTITTHLEHVYRKLGVNSRVAAVTEGARLGLYQSATA